MYTEKTERNTQRRERMGDKGKTEGTTLSGERGGNKGETEGKIERERDPDVETEEKT
jgi:hypothetical protein